MPARLLSGGEQQMVVLAQALVSQPQFILIDELSLGLAPVIVNQLIPVIRSVADSGVGVLLIEQFATVALSLATGAHVMEGGVLRYSGTAAELKDRPELLQSAYLLRGSEVDASQPSKRGSWSRGPRPVARPGYGGSVPRRSRRHGVRQSLACVQERARSAWRLRDGAPATRSRSRFQRSWWRWS